MVRRILAVALAALGAAAVFFYVTLPDVRPLASAFPRTTAFMERRRLELSRSGQDPSLEWTPVPLARISPALRNAVIAAEDARFYEHSGFDWGAVRVAAQKDWERGSLRVGASTITQQLAKNLYLSPARTPWRKLRELAITRRLESALSKHRILELYLNVVEFGSRTYGAEAAARRYFGKSASDLSSHEGAVLAAVIASPRIYDPVRHTARVERRAARILRSMHQPEEGPVDGGASRDLGSPGNAPRPLTPARTPSNPSLLSSQQVPSSRR